MFIGYFTERPYQDRRSGYFGLAGRDITDLSMSNGSYDPVLGADLYNRYLDEKVYAEEMGFDGLMLCDGQRTVAQVVAAVPVAADPSVHGESLTDTVLQALRVLYVDGVVAELRERSV